MPKLTIKDHAIVRYLERVKGMDINKLREEIMEEADLGIINELGDGLYPVKNYKLVVVNNSVITVKDKKCRSKFK